ncbi:MULTISPECIES: hypothetical protein [Salinibaculum]|uniref:hypothetical protein n=1 Tax=Salinibaculum TaxID=2732368 RepID=UPI0030D1BDB5
MVGIQMSGQFALLVGLLGALWIYLDGRKRNMETADMWAVGFFVGMFIPPIIGAVVVAVLYSQKRNRGRGSYPVQHRR